MREKISRNAPLWVFFCFLTVLMAAVPDFAAASGSGKGAMQNFNWNSSPVDVADIEFRDGEDKLRKLSDFRGQIILLNFWATWCAPCRKEMPDLDALQKKFGGKDFMVLALSQDRKGPKAVREFYRETGVKNLDLYIDQKARTSRKLRSPGLPTTILINRKGQEIGRLVGPADWFSEEAQAIVQKAVQLK